eukprot:scaffold76265_cov60-Phaeocystis_antarctica.AAC.2
MVHAAGVVGIGVWDVARRDAVGAARKNGNTTLEYGGGRVEVGRRGIGAPVDGEGALTVILIRNRQIVGRTGVGAARHVVHTLRAARGIDPVVERSRVPAVVRAAAELPAAASSARAVAEARNVEGGSCIFGHAACDATRAVFQVVQSVVVVGQRVGAPRKQRRAKAVVNRGGLVVVGARAVSAPAVGASATGGVGTLVEVQSGRVEAAGHGADAFARQHGRGVVVDRRRVNASLVEARGWLVLEGGQRAVVARVRLHAPRQHWRAAAVIEGRARFEGVEAAVHATALHARAVVRHGEGAVVQRRAGGAAVGRGRRRRRRRRGLGVSTRLGDDRLLASCEFVAHHELATLS